MSNLIEQNISLADKNWFGTGGIARFFSQPTTIQEFQRALTFAQQNKLPLFLLGHGANILISDEGFDGLVIRPALKNIEIIDIDKTEALVVAGAGVSMPELIQFCLAHNVVGLEEFSGIPGTVGGSVYINLHYFEFLLEQFLHSAVIIDAHSHEAQTVDTSWFKFGYNQSTLLEKKHYLVQATFKLKKANDIETAYAKGRSIEIIRHRARRYPQAGTCGSFFRNFFEHEIALSGNDKKVVWVAYYLDKIGVKGQLRKGGAQVSHQHANMIVNTGNATSKDIIELAQTMQEMVQQQFGLVPQAECQLIGFKQYPLR